MKGSTGGGGGGGGGTGTTTRRKGGITEADRIFSRSSAVVNRVRLFSQFTKCGGRKIRRTDKTFSQDSPAPSAPPSSHAPTPTSGAATPGIAANGSSKPSATSLPS